MILGVGTDLIEMERVIKAYQRPAFQKRYYTKKEQELISGDKRKSAGNFAVKEAVSKVMGTGFYKMEPVEIEVLRDSLGKPYVNLYGKASDMAKELGISKIHVSITNTKDFVSAFAVGEGD